MQKVTKLGIINAPYYVSKAKEYLPQAELVLVDSPRQFFTGKSEDFDGLVYSAEAGSAWTLLYPAFSVVVPQPDVLAVPLRYGMPRGERDLADFVNTWIELKTKDQTIRVLYDYWILGQTGVERSPRWSVIRDVLHLVKGGVPKHTETALGGDHDSPRDTIASLPTREVTERARPSSHVIRRVWKFALAGVDSRRHVPAAGISRRGVAVRYPACRNDCLRSFLA